MKIENIEIDIVDIDLTRPYTIAYKTTSSIKTLVLKIILRDGTVGLGASNVSKYVVGLDTMDSYNNSKEYIEHLKGNDIDSFWMIINDIENKFIDDPGSKAAFNLAVYDAYCKNKQVRVTIANPNKNETNKPFIRVNARDVWGPPSKGFQMKSN